MISDRANCDTGTFGRRSFEQAPAWMDAVLRDLQTVAETQALHWMAQDLERLRANYCAAACDDHDVRSTSRAA